MVDTTIYIQQLTFKLRDANKRNVELSAENAQLKLQIGLLEMELKEATENKYIYATKECKKHKSNTSLTWYTLECSNCGKELSHGNNYNFCPKCGRRFKKGENND